MPTTSSIGEALGYGLSFAGDTATAEQARPFLEEAAAGRARSGLQGFMDRPIQSEFQSGLTAGGIDLGPTGSNEDFLAALDEDLLRGGRSADVAGYSSPELTAMDEVLGIFGGMDNYNQWWHSLRGKKPRNWEQAAQMVSDTPVDGMLAGGLPEARGAQQRPTGTPEPDVSIPSGIEDIPTEGFDFVDVLETDAARRLRQEPALSETNLHSPMSDAAAFAESFAGEGLEYDRGEHAGEYFSNKAPAMPHSQGDTLWAEDRAGDVWPTVDEDAFLQTRGQPPYDPLWNKQELRTRFPDADKYNYPALPPGEGQTYNMYPAGVQDYLLKKAEEEDTKSPTGKLWSVGGGGAAARTTALQMLKHKGLTQGDMTRQFQKAARQISQ